jgi:hypothetical protein
VSFGDVVRLDKTEDLFCLNAIPTLVNDGIADLSYQDNQARWSVIVLRVSPDEHNGMHDGDKQVGDIYKVLGLISKLVEEILEGVEVLVVLIGFVPSSLDLFLQLTEGAGIGRLVLLKELEDLLDLL